VRDTTSKALGITLFTDDEIQNLIDEYYNHPDTSVVRKRPPEVGKAISAAKMGHVVSEETRQKISATKRGKKMSAAAYASLKNRPAPSVETRAKLAKSSAGRLHSETSKQKMRKPKSPETIERMRLAAKAREEKKRLNRL